jgi:uncharacterized membrane protein
MRWLLVALLVSLTALLIAAAGVARHIWVRRARVRSKPSASAAASALAEEADRETEI